MNRFRRTLAVATLLFAAGWVYADAPRLLFLADTPDAFAIARAMESVTAGITRNGLHDGEIDSQLDHGQEMLDEWLATPAFQMVMPEIPNLPQPNFSDHNNHPTFDLSTDTPTTFAFLAKVPVTRLDIPPPTRLFRAPDTRPQTRFDFGLRARAPPIALR